MSVTPAVDNDKFCVKCKHQSYDEYHNRICTREQMEARCLVTGKMVQIGTALKCGSQRASQKDIDCGAIGRFYEPR